jgi:hypothetical protein
MRTSSDRTELGRIHRAFLYLVTILAVAAGVGLLFYRGVGPLPNPEGCTAKVGGVVVDLDPEQGENAAVIAAIGVRRGLPARAVSIALATAFQESKLHNLDSGDRDSLGLFQQRPSQGWGTAAQIQNPYYAANRFYDELDKVHGYERMRITVAAQRVQRSGFPEAYAGHATDARALASALTGYSPAKFSCVVHEHSSVDEPTQQALDQNGLTPRAEMVRHDLVKAFGPLAVHRVPAEHGRGFDVPVPLRSPRGWAVAHYLVAQANRLDIAHVAIHRLVWTAGSASEHGWQPAHHHRPTVVHVDVLRGTG